MAWQLGCPFHFEQPLGSSDELAAVALIDTAFSALESSDRSCSKAAVGLVGHWEQRPVNVWSSAWAWMFFKRFLIVWPLYVINAHVAHVSMTMIMMPTTWDCWLMLNLLARCILLLSDESFHVLGCPPFDMVFWVVTVTSARPDSCSCCSCFAVHRR